MPTRVLVVAGQKIEGDIARSLRAAGYDVIEEANYSEAYDTLNVDKYRFDVVLICGPIDDSDEDGLELVREISRDGFRAIICFASDNTQAIEEAVEHAIVVRTLSAEMLSRTLGQLKPFIPSVMH